MYIGKVAGSGHDRLIKQLCSYPTTPRVSVDMAASVIVCLTTQSSRGVGAERLVHPTTSRGGAFVGEHYTYTDICMYILQLLLFRRVTYRAGPLTRTPSRRSPVQSTPVQGRRSHAWSAGSTHARPTTRSACTANSSIWCPSPPWGGLHHQNEDRVSHMATRVPMAF